MRVRSLGYRTDFIFARHGGEIVERADYVVVRTPRQPEFYWGNLLLYPAAPVAGDLARWSADFENEFPTAVTHQLFGWDDPDGRRGAADEFLAAGFALDEAVVLTATRVDPPPHPNDEVEMRVLESDRDWDQARTCQVLCRDPVHDKDAYEDFQRGLLRHRREMAEEGLGHWFAAFRGSQQVANLGLFTDGDIARFQTVATHPDHRGRGICGTLVHHASRYAFEHMGVRELVLVADDGGDAESIYRDLGYQERERQVALLKRPDPPAPT